MEKQKSLTQKEIDALLAILPEDGSSLPGVDYFAGSARAYDFRSPDKFSKEQIRTLQMIHENFARQISSSLSAYLRTTVQLTCVHVEQGSFADFIQNIPSPSPVTVLKMEPLPGRVLLALDTGTATVAVDRLLGGFGQPAKDGHQITDIEQSLVYGVIEQLTEELQEAWKNVVTLKITIEETALNPEFVQVALPSDAAVFLGFEIKVQENSGMLSICIPYSVLKPIVSELSPHTWVAGEAREAGIYREAMLKHLNYAQVDVSVLLGEITVDFEELLHLQPGDVLVLDTSAGRTLPVLVGDRKKYLAQPGLIGSHLGVQIMTVTEKTADG